VSHFNSLLSAALSPTLAVTETEPAAPSEVGTGEITIMLAIAAFLVWVSYLITSSRRRRKPETTPKNLQPWLSDDELENTRLTRVLSSAMISAAVLAIVLPVYYINESNRQANAAENFAEQDVDEGGHFFVKFECSICHGPDGGGGTAEHIEERTGLTVPWLVPALNDVFFRYSEEEVRFWIEFGRPGTPMPPAGLAGGGAMTVQEVDQVLAYVRSIQLPQVAPADDPEAPSAFAKVDGAVTLAVNRIREGANAVARQVFEQQAAIDDILDAVDQFVVIDDCHDLQPTDAGFECATNADGTRGGTSYPDRVRALLAGDGSCTDESAALVGSTCSAAGWDGDRDGLADEAERRLTAEIGPVLDATVTVRRVKTRDGALVVEHVPNIDDFAHLYELSLLPNNPFSMTDARGHEVADLETVDEFLRSLDAAHLNLGVLTRRQTVFLAAAESGLGALEDAAAAGKWKVDFGALAVAMSDRWLESVDPDDVDLTDEQRPRRVSLAEAERAVGLFNAYCARCHTAGYSAGVAFEQGQGTGAWAPALTGGRAPVQFPTLDDHIDFITRGTELGQNYGTNGLGRGWMPGFGQVLSAEDIRLIALLERAL
jgi:mono/diheme cytochrome c family protein